MSKLKPNAPRKEEWDSNEWQGRSKKQVDSDNAVTAFAVICLLATVIVAVIHEIYLWLK